MPEITRTVWKNVKMYSRNAFCSVEFSFWDNRRTCGFQTWRKIHVLPVSVPPYNISNGSLIFRSYFTLFVFASLYISSKFKAKKFLWYVVPTWWWYGKRGVISYWLLRTVNSALQFLTTAIMLQAQHSAVFLSRAPTYVWSWIQENLCAPWNLWVHRSRLAVATRVQGEPRK